MTNATLSLTTEDFIVGHVVQFSTLAEDRTRYELIVGTVVGHSAGGVDIEIIDCDPNTEPGEGRPGEIVNWLPQAIGGLIDITALEASVQTEKKTPSTVIDDDVRELAREILSRPRALVSSETWTLADAIAALEES